MITDREWDALLWLCLLPGGYALLFAVGYQLFRLTRRVRGK